MLTTTLERLDGNSVKLTVTVPAEEVDAAIKRAYEALGKKIRIPGFRRGHAPRPVVDNYVGKDQVLAEATEGLVDSTYPTAIDAESLRPIEAPEIDEVAMVVPGEDFTYIAQVEIRPELTLSSLEGIEVTVPPRGVTEAQVDEQIEIARDRFASLEPVEGRALEGNDYALISFVGEVDGEAYEGNTVDMYLYEMGSGQMPAMFDEGILGMSAGETKRVEFVIPETSSREEYVGKTAGFDVTLHEIKAKVLPEIDDEFAESVGGYDSVELMREDIKIRLKSSQELNHERAKEEAVKAALAERLEGDVPDAMVRVKTGQMMRDFQNMLEQRGMTVEGYATSVGASLEFMEADIARQAAQAVKEELALEALFRAEGLEVTDEDVQKEVAGMATSEQSVDDLMRRWSESGLMPIIREQIIHQRAVKWLYENCKIVESDGTQADASAEKTTEE